jgi:glycosyltransferase involved in cell wall biosynthesis
MKVLIVTPRYYPNTLGGGERSVHLIAKALYRYVDVEVYSQDGEVNGVEEVEGIKIMRKNLLFDGKISKNIKCIRDLVSNIEYDLIHSYNMDLMPATGFLTKYFNVKSVATLNGRVYSRHSEWYTNYKNASTLPSKIKGCLFLIRNAFMKSNICGITRYSVLCPYRREVFVREGFEREKFTVIPNILDSSFKPEVQIQTGKVRILYVGSLNWLKGLDVLLQAYSLLDRGRLELMVVGVSQKNAPPHPPSMNPVTFLGRLRYEDLPHIYAQADIYVNSYRYPEPVSRSVLEAMQTGLPVITTGIASYSPIVRDKVDGILVYPFTPGNLAEAMQYLIDNPRIRKNMGSSAKTRVQKVCNPRRIGGLYLEMYRKALGDD